MVTNKVPLPKKAILPPRCSDVVLKGGPYWILPPGSLAWAHLFLEISGSKRVCSIGMNEFQRYGLVRTPRQGHSGNGGNAGAGRTKWPNDWDEVKAERKDRPEGTNRGSGRRFDVSGPRPMNASAVSRNGIWEFSAAVHRSNSSNPSITDARPLDRFIPNPKLRLRLQIKEVMRFKHYSSRTESAYWHWIRRYIHFFNARRHPREMGAVEVGEFLSHLATQRNVAASTQNQALNALVFLYSEVLNVSLGEIGSWARALRPVTSHRSDLRGWNKSIGSIHRRHLNRVASPSAL